ncbi:uncharacterized protein LOC123015154 [Tribolium madens]|uniref:uncharacterized protein LOC123015154 n=1 Tax=Tribolium madens TaxID=41895 RepID=UPI001CF75029|nr:uncharacterized protein LOC123015154 [Tribolium madens]
MVILKEENVSASNWPLARIIKVHPDPDNVTRVVTLKKQGGTTMDRPIHKLILLPVQSEQTSPEVCQKPSIGRPKISRSAHFLWKASMIAILFLTTIGKSAASSTTSLYHVEYPQPGFFIEHIGHATIERGTFRIEVKFQKFKIKNDTETVQKIIQNMESFCNQTLEFAADNIDCSPLIQQLKEKEKELSWIKLGLEISLKKREKRGVLNTLLTSIFGVNDEVYKDISDLDKNQRELIQASHHQTKFMLQALSKFNDTEFKIYQKLNQFQEKLNQGLSAINNMQHWYSSVDHNIATYQIASTFLDELITHYKSLLNMHVNQANLYEFISPAQIKNIIITSSKKLPSNIKILSYPILRTDLAHSKQFIHLYGYFTMSEVADFMLLKGTPIPHKDKTKSHIGV